MIIDAHGHYTTAPAKLAEFRAAQLAAGGAATRPPPFDDAEVRASLERGQLRVMDERGIDVMLISPRAAGMEHHVPSAAVADSWARVCNDLVAQAAALFPDRFAPVAQLPQTPDGNLSGVIAELRRTVEQLGFVACNLNPDPSGSWAGAPITDEAWFDLFEVLVELDVPAMIHVSTACNPNHDTLGAHYLNADTSVFMQLLGGDLFQRFPSLRLVIPHGGGAVPYHWGRYRGLAMRRGLPDPARLLDNVYFDTCVYHQAGIDLLTRVVPPGNLVFASEMLGAVRGADPETGVEWDDTAAYLRGSSVTAEELAGVMSGNAMRVYPRLAARLSAVGR